MANETALLVAYGTRDQGNDGNREVEWPAADWHYRNAQPDIPVCWIESAPVPLKHGMEQAASALCGTSRHLRPDGNADAQLSRGGCALALAASSPEHAH